MDPGLQGGAVPSVLLVSQDSNLFRIGVDPFACSIGRAIIDNQELKRHSRPSHFRKQPLNKGTNPPLLVIHGDYDADAFSLPFGSQGLSLRTFLYHAVSSLLQSSMSNIACIIQRGQYLPTITKSRVS